ncbi:MAG TPA: amidohydrolase family protein [Vicinamibacterales bacterium]
MTSPMAGSVLENACVLEHDRVAVRPLAFAAGRIVDAPTDALRVDLRDHVIVPGLINAHDHLHLNNIPPLRHTGPFPNSYAWIDAFEPRLGDPEVVAATQVSSEARHWQGGLKNLLAGVTTVAHHDPWLGVLDDPAFPVGLLQNFGWSHSLGLGTPRGGLPPRYGPPVGQSFVTTPVAHPWTIHLAEGTDHTAATELAQLDTLGCLASNTVLVHGVGLTGPDVERVIESGAAVVWCPASNLGMLGRTVDAGTLRRLFAAGRLTLGSDSRLTGSRDLLDELRVARIHSDLSPSELLRLVTCDARRILRLDDRGALHPGQRADCSIVRAGADPYRSLLDIGRADIRAVVREGAPVVADPDFAGWFAHCGVDVAEIRVDGRPKLMARPAARPSAIALEPGLEIM